MASHLVNPAIASHLVNPNLEVEHDELEHSDFANVVHKFLSGIVALIQLYEFLESMSACSVTVVVALVAEWRKKKQPSIAVATQAVNSPVAPP
eukprot:6039377-Amphidinium_carterae.1